MDIRAIGMGMAFALMWSAAFTSARIIVQYAPPLYSLSLRFFLTGLIAIALAKIVGQTWRLTRTQWILTVLFGLCQNGLYLGLNFVAMQTIEASLASIIASAMPLLVALALWVFFGERMTRVGLVGLVAGIVGVGIILGPRLGGGVDAVGVAMCVVAVLSLTAATLAVRGASSGGNLLMVVGLQMLIGAAVLLPFAAAFETPDFNPDWRLAAAFSFTVIFPGLIATWIWFVLVGRIGATKAATFHFLNPVFGVAVAAVLLGEHVSVWDVVGVCVVTFGILAVQLSRQTKP